MFNIGGFEAYYGKTCVVESDCWSTMNDLFCDMNNTEHWMCAYKNQGE